MAHQVQIQAISKIILDRAENDSVYLSKFSSCILFFVLQPFHSCPCDVLDCSAYAYAVYRVYGSMRRRRRNDKSKWQCCSNFSINCCRCDLHFGTKALGASTRCFLFTLLLSRCCHCGCRSVLLLSLSLFVFALSLRLFHNKNVKVVRASVAWVWEH